MSMRIWMPIILIVLGALFWMGKFGIIDFYWSRDWPVVLIGAGVFSLINYIAGRVKRGGRSQRKKRDILGRLERGDIDAEEAIRKMKNL